MEKQRIDHSRRGQKLFVADSSGAPAATLSDRLRSRRSLQGLSEAAGLEARIARREQAIEQAQARVDRMREKVGELKQQHAEAVKKESSDQAPIEEVAEAAQASSVAETVDKKPQRERKVRKVQE